MKNLFTYVIIFIGAGILFSSCSNIMNVSFTKRLYRNGYYVEHSNKRQALKQKERETVYLVKPDLVSPQQIKTTVEKNIVLKTDNINEIKQSNSSNNNSVDKKQAYHKSGIEKAATSNSLAVDSKFNSPVKVQKNKSTFEKILKSPSDNPHSLLAVLIAILLIIWLVGILSGGWGMGGLIHILLVIAVILLIIWLLGLS